MPGRLQRARDPLALRHHLVIAFLVCSSLLVLLLPAHTKAASFSSTIVPAYWGDDSSQWQQLFQTHPAGTIALSSGPPAAGDSAFTNEVNQAHNAGIRVVGYVGTAYTGRALSDIQSDINAWYSYPIDGIMVDQVRGNSANVSYYQQVASMIRGASGGNGHLVILNPGWIPTTNAYLQFSDIIIIFEGILSNYSAFSPPSWMSDPARFAMIIEDVPSAQVSATLLQNVQFHVGYTYLTDTTQEYDRLPSYWNQEVAGMH